MPSNPRYFSVLSDESPPDQRLGEVRNLHQTFECPTYASIEEWQREAEAIRRHILVSCGLHPMPERTPLNPEIFGRIEREDYAIEKVRFEAYPGYLVAGNLYRPLGKKGPFPGVLGPHGHGKRGRLTNEERFSVPVRAINLARQGYVCFQYDMVGYNDSLQFTHRARPPADELWGLSLMGLQLWNGIRSLDFLLSLSDVDPERVACTGASGGGTQTFMLTAIDDRVGVSAPVNMVSAHMQGGCACENAPSLRLEIINPQIAALAAPRPLLMVSATGDWTTNTPETEFPFVRSIYALHGVEDRVKNVHIDAGHNYNQPSREAVYGFFGRWVCGKKTDRPIAEPATEVERDEDLLVFPDKELPDGFEKGRPLADKLIAERKARTARWMAQCTEQRGVPRSKEIAALRDAFAHTLNVAQPKADDLNISKKEKAEAPTFRMEKFLLGRKSAGDSIPSLLIRPINGQARGPVALALHPSGKEALLDAVSQKPGALVQALLDKGISVLAIDAFLTGEYARPGGQVGRNLGGVAHWTTYNRTDLAERVQDILTAIAHLKSRRDVSSIHLLGLDRAGIWCLLARTQTSDVERAVVDLAQLDLGVDATWTDDLFIPGLRLCGDTTGAAILAAPAPLTIMNGGSGFDSNLIRKAYASYGEGQALRVSSKAMSPGAIAGTLTSKE